MNSLGRWRRIEGADTLPIPARVKPIAIATARGIVQTYGLWGESEEGEYRWYGIDGKQLQVKVLAWYELPIYHEENHDDY